MKFIYLSIFLYCCISFNGQSNPSEESYAILMEDISLQEDQQHLKALLNEKQKKEIILIGQVRSILIPTQKDSKVVQVVWTGVKSKNKKKASLKEPLISTFKSKKGVLSKGLKISLYGNKVHLSNAIERLEKGEDEQGSGELRADNPSSNDRRLEDMEGKINKRPSLRNHSDLDAPIEDNIYQDNASMNFSSESYQRNPSSSSGDGKSATSMIRKHSNPLNNINGRKAGSSLNGKGRHAPYKKDYSSTSPGSLSSQLLSPVAQSSSQEPGIQQVQKEALISDKHLNKDFVESPKGGFDLLKINQEDALGGDKFKMPLIEVEITREGCCPTIDLKRSKVIVQTRSMTRKDGVLVSETPCRDSDLIFDIKKDYGCCSDKVDEIARVAYTTFRRYYLDEGYNKVYLDAECIKDESQPHPFIEEKGDCRYEIHLPSRLAYPQCETVYYDRSNAKKIVKGCHRSGEPPLPIIATAEGCPLKHVYEQNKSFIQNKEVFVDHGIVHEVVPCHETEQSIPHQFVKAGCKPLVNGSQVTPMAKRQIVYKGKQKIIKEQCEPQDLTQLQSTRVGCEGQYEHDFNSGRSYPLARHYYYWGGKNRFIDKICRRSNQALDHLREIIGYEHVDSELKSKPRYQISIEDQKKKHILQELTEDNKGKWIPYTLRETIEKPSKSKGPTSQGSNITFAKDKIEVWTRPDGSLFEKVIGTGTAESISISPNDGSGKIIVSVTEQFILPGPYVDGSMKYKVRKVTRYSDGSVDFGRPFIRVVPGHQGQYISNYHSNPNFYFEHNE